MSEVNNDKNIHNKNILRNAVSELADCSSEVLDKIIVVIKALKSFVFNETAFKNISELSKKAQEPNTIEKVKSIKECDNETKIKLQKDINNKYESATVRKSNKNEKPMGTSSNPAVQLKNQKTTTVKSNKNISTINKKSTEKNSKNG